MKRLRICRLACVVREMQVHRVCCAIWASYRAKNKSDSDYRNIVGNRVKTIRMSRASKQKESAVQFVPICFMQTKASHRYLQSTVKPAGKYFNAPPIVRLVDTEIPQA